MKNLCFLLLSLFLSFHYLNAQNSNLVFYTPKSEEFYVELNGVKQNTEASEFVRIKNYNQTGGRVIIKFKNSSLGKANTDLKFHTGKESVFTVKNNGMSYSVKWEKDHPIVMAPDTEPHHLEVNYKTPEGKEVSKALQGQNSIKEYKGKKGCEVPMSSSDFRYIKANAIAKGFDDGIVSFSIKKIRKGCISSLHAKQIMQVLKSNEAKMNFAALCYENLYDIDNFDEVLNMLRTEQSKKEVKQALGI